MRVHRIYAIVLRHFYIFRRSADRMSDAFYWPLIDLFIWGLTSQYFANTTRQPNIILFILSGLIFWTVVWRGQQEVSMTLLEELWNKNLVNIFVPPLTFSEWIISILTIAITKTAMSLTFAAILAFVLYKVNIFYYGWYLFPFMILLLMTAWAVGFFVCGLILRYGTKIQTLAWSLIAILSPFTGIYYNISILPPWAQKVALYIPTSYVFEGAHAIIQKGQMDLHRLLISFLLNSIYLILAMIYLRSSFDKVLEKGLTKIN